MKLLFIIGLLLLQTPAPTLAPVPVPLDDLSASRLQTVIVESQLIQTQHELAEARLQARAKDIVDEAYRKANLSPSTYAIDTKTMTFTPRESK